MISETFGLDQVDPATVQYPEYLLLDAALSTISAGIFIQSVSTLFETS